MIKAVVFDLDHTLFDRYETIKHVASNLHNYFKLNPNLSLKQITELMISTDKNYVHKGWDRIETEIAKLGIFLQDLKPQEYHNAVMNEFMKVAVPFDFTIPCLEQLRSAGYKTALITNGIPKLQRKKLEMLKIYELFDYIYIGGEHEFSKPNVQPFIETAKMLSVTPYECVYVGDNPVNDIEPSRKAGYIPIHVQTTGNWVCPEIIKPKYSVKTVKEIPELIEKINREQV